MTQQEPPSGSRQGFTSAQAFDRAATLHQQGRLGEAEQLYRAILQHNPDHFGALHYLGIIASQHGHPHDAEQLIRRALTLNAGSADAHNDLGISLANLGRLEDAIVEYQSAVALDPRHIGAHGNLGNALHATGRSGEAIAHFQEVLAARPSLAEMHNNLGNALAAVQRGEEAVASYHKALGIRPDFAEAYNNLGVALAALQRPAEAIAEYERATALRPRYSEAHNNLANALASLNRHAEAIAHFETALAIKPDAAGTHNNFGNVLAALKRRDEAVSHFRRAIEIRPDYFEAHNNLGNALAASDRPADAIPHYRKAIEINPRYAEAHNNLGNIHGALERYEEAIECYGTTLALDPNFAETYYCLGNALVTIGRIEEGRQALERAVALAPRRPEFYRILGECKRFTADDPHLSAMEALAQEMGSFTDDERIILHFVLAKAYDDTGRPDAAFHHLGEANRLRRTQVDYDEATTLGLHRRAISVFTPELIQDKAGLGDPSNAPVFVLGMPRSGTTLIEQILASHPKVFGGGELLALHNAVYNLFAQDGPAAFPEAVSTATAEQFRLIGEHYVRTVTAMAPSAERITDKALGNFVFIGLIRIALPNARIIHARRNPVDTCLSCFSKLFTSELLYTYDLGELARYYRSYETLMEHWRRVLPAGAMLEVQYEEMVDDFAAQARRIVEYCGLEWDDRCLAFHQTKRPVRTASATQVRQPIYNTSIDRWRPYATMLQPLLDELKR